MIKLVNNSYSNAPYKSLWLNKLDGFLRSHGAFPVIKLHGFLTAINSGPNMILPSQWLPLSKIQGIDFESTKQATDIMSDVMSLCNNINTGLRKKTYKPIFYLPSEPNQNNVSYEEIWKEMMDNTKLWANGYWIGMEATWPFKDHIEFNTEIHPPLGIIYYLTLPKQEFIKECKALNMTVEEYYQVVIECLPAAAIEIYDFWLNNREEYSTEGALQVINDFKAGRNDQCPCGSGKKYIKCCLH